MRNTFQAIGWVVLLLAIVVHAEPPSSYGAPGSGAQPVFRQQQGHSQSAPQSSQYGAPQQFNAPSPQAAPQQYNAPAPQAQQQYNAPAPQAQQQYNAPAPQAQQGYNAPQEQAQEGGKIHKHVYVHVAPDEEPEHHAQRPRKPQPAPEKHYKILFIKAPSTSAGDGEEIQLPPLPETKTLVYVLLKKPEFAGGINFATPAPTQPSKPEVYFIRYKSGGNKEQGKQEYGAPAPQQAPQQYNAPAPQQQAQYSAPAPQSQQYNAPAPQSQQYNAPAPQSQQYNAPAPQAPQQYNAPAPQPQYNAPAPQQFNAPSPHSQQQYNAPAPQQMQQYNAPVSDFARHARHSHSMRYFGHQRNFNRY
jgi:hypothetical protein